MLANSFTVTARGYFPHFGGARDSLPSRVYGETTARDVAKNYPFGRHLPLQTAAGLKGRVRNFGSSDIFVAPIMEKTVAASQKTLWQHPLVVRAFADLDSTGISSFRPSPSIRSVNGYDLQVWEHRETGVRVIVKEHDKSTTSIDTLIAAVKAGRISGDGIVPMAMGEVGTKHFFELDIRGLGQGREPDSFESLTLRARLAGGIELKEAYEKGDPKFSDLYLQALAIFRQLEILKFEHNHPHYKNWIVHPASDRRKSTITLIDFTKLKPLPAAFYGSVAQARWFDAAHLARIADGEVEKIDSTSFYFSDFHDVRFNDAYQMFLYWCDLSGADFSGRDINVGLFDFSIFDGADFTGTRFTNGCWSRVSLDGANFSGASFLRTFVFPKVLEHLSRYLDNIYVRTNFDPNPMQIEITTSDRLDELDPVERDQYRLLTT